MNDLSLPIVLKNFVADGAMTIVCPAGKSWQRSF
jgi:hypothetical protein